MSTSFRVLGSLLAVWLLGLTAAFAGYRVEDVKLPAASLSAEILAIAFSPEGDLYVANRLGEIWRASAEGENWTRFASGLHEPLGLLVDSNRVAHVLQRPELTRIEDSDGDGVADVFTTLADDWGITGNYHEFPYGLRRDRDGNLVGALGLSSGGEREFANMSIARGTVQRDAVRGEQQWSVVPYRGWSFAVTPAGKFIPWSHGFRQPVGIGMSPEGEFFVVDTQGDWVASSGLIHNQRGRFYGHPASAKWAEGGLGGIRSDEGLAQRRTPVSVLLPHGAVGISPGEPVWDTTGGKFGPFKHQVFIGDFSQLVSRVFLEKVAGEFQGAAFPFFRSPKLRQGNMCMAFAPTGALYVGQASWGSGQGLQRIVWDGAMPVEIHSLRVRESGFTLDFTVEMDRGKATTPARYTLKRFRYLYHEKYGSPRIDEAVVSIAALRLSEDGRRLEIDLAEVAPGFVYEFQLEEVTAATGELIANPTAFYTVNQLPSGRHFEGPFTARLVPTENPGVAVRLDAGLGKEIYLKYCVACHQPDGRGGTVAADFVGDKTRLAKSDTELIRTIRRGVENEKLLMPPFGSILTDPEIRSVVHYLRETFDPIRARGR